MEVNVTKELAQLSRMTVRELQAKYAEMFGEATRARHKQWLVKRVIWRIQAQAEGGLSARARQRAAELARETDLRLSPPKQIPEQSGSAIQRTAVISRKSARLPAPGTVITRPYKGNDLQLKVLADGFEYEGEHYRSLSSLAKQITGSHCNGYQFFRLGQHGGKQ